jgi:hypothetical protein
MHRKRGNSRPSEGISASKGELETKQVYICIMVMLYFLMLFTFQRASDMREYSALHDVTGGVKSLLAPVIAATAIAALTIDLYYILL